MSEATPHTVEVAGTRIGRLVQRHVAIATTIILTVGSIVGTVLGPVVTAKLTSQASNAQGDGSRATATPTATPTITFTPTIGPPTVKINDPAEGASVPYELDISGTATGLRPGEVVWLFDHQDRDPELYPEDFPCPVEEDGTWFCPDVIIGEENDDRRYEVVAVIADAEAQRGIIRYHNENIQSETPYAHGMATFPRGTFVPHARATAGDSSIEGERRRSLEHGGVKPPSVRPRRMRRSGSVGG